MSVYKRKNYSIIKAVELLEILEKAAQPLALSAICEETQMPKSTVHGLLDTMRETGLICQKEDSGKYWLGDRLTDFGMAVVKFYKKEQSDNEA